MPADTSAVAEADERIGQRARASLWSSTATMTLSEIARISIQACSADSRPDIARPLRSTARGRARRALAPLSTLVGQPPAAAALAPAG